jgi:hypothetical protein
MARRIAGGGESARRTTPPRKSGSGLALPSKPKAADFDLSHYITILYGREKIGKTTMAASFPDAIFFATEPGTKGLEVYELNAENGGVKDWSILREGIDLLEGTDRFKTVVIDTADRAYELCAKYICGKLGIDHQSLDKTGKQDRSGRGWQMVRTEFMEQINRIVQSGRGIVFTSHSKEALIQSRSGDEYTRIQPTMTGQARGVIEPLADLFIYCEYMKNTEGETKRIMITEGDELVCAGGRTAEGGSLPKYLPMVKSGGFELLQKAFAGDYPGLNPKTLTPRKDTGEGAKSRLRKDQSKGSGAKRRRK